MSKLDGLKYETTGTKKPNSKQVLKQAAEQLSTMGLLWIVVKRHKVALLAFGNIVLVLNWAIPEWPQIAKSFIR